MGLPEDERMQQLADPAVRAMLDERARSKEAGVFRGLSHWGTYVIGDTYAAANDGCAFRSVADIAAERGTAPFDTLLDIVLADDLRTVLWPNTDDGDEDTWTMRAAIWSDPRAMVGGSDAGAHLDRMCGSNYPTAFLGDCLRGRKLVPVEKAVHMMTAQPAAALRPARSRAWCGRATRPTCSSSTRPPSAPSPPVSCTTCPATPRGCSPAPTASCACWSTASRRCATAPPPGPAGHAAAVRPRHGVGHPGPGLSPGSRRRRLACVR